MKKRKKKTELQKVKEKLWKVICQYIKLRDYNICQMCSRSVMGSNAHTSHVIPKSQGNILRYDETNLKLLCYHCHINIWHKNPVESGGWFKNKFPKRWEYIIKKKETYCKFGIPDYIEMIRKYEQKVKELTTSR